MQQRYILVVDDLTDNQLLLQFILEAAGYEVEVASDGSSALAQIAIRPPALVLLDVMMPGISGYEVARQMRQRPELSSIPVLFVTADRDADAPEQQSVAISTFIYKPIDPEEVVKRVNAVLKRPHSKSRLKDRRDDREAIEQF